MSSNEPQQENNQEEIKENKQNYKMSLLFIQTKELKRLYNSKMENLLRKYHIVDKSFLDEFKSKNDYKSAIEMFDSFNDWKNYEDFRDVMGDSFLVDDDYFTRIFSTVKCKRVKFKNAINYPKNVELVCAQYFKDCFKGVLACPACQILIGDKSIIIFDDECKNKKKPIIYICSLKKEKEGEYNFEIQVDCIISYKDMDTMNKELDEISKSKGIFNYLIKRKLDINNSDEQDIINENNESIGKFNSILFDDSNEEENNNQNINESQKNSVHKHKVLFNIYDSIRKNNNININNNNPTNNNGNQMNQSNELGK